MMCNLIKETKEQYGGSLSKGDLWQFLKRRIKEHTITYSIKKAICKKDEIREIETNLDKIDFQCTQSSNVEEMNMLQNRRHEYKEKLNTYYLDRAIGAQIRSKAKWVEEGERSTSFFLNLEKQHQSHNSIKSVKYGSLKASDNEGILDICTQFYSNLYKSTEIPDSKVDSYLKGINVPRKLSEDEKRECDGRITVNECDIVIQKLKKHKSPGLDGLTAEFYIKFWTELKDIVTDSYNESYDLACLPESMRLAVMSLIFKKGDAENLENFRPISLINVDYKILTFALANRIHKVIGKLINPNQVAYIHKRFIGTNIRLINDVFDNADEGLLFFLDFHKAFDSVEWNFIFNCLKRYNFGDSFIKWIRLIYTKPMICIKNNGYLSKSFEIFRGVRQGCPVSCLLFIICVEALADKVRQADNIEGIKLDKTSAKICQYADDATLFLRHDNDFKKCICIISEFGKTSGMKLNMTKCEGLWLGNDAYKQYDCTLGDIKWPTAPIKCLGVYIGHNKDECTRLNWSRKIEKLKNILECWKTRRNLTLFGKVQVIKCLAMSGLVYSATHCAIPNRDVIKEINKALYEFLWGKTEFIKRNILINDIKEGGINMIDVEAHFQSLKASWSSKINDLSSNEQWLEIPHQKLNKLGNKLYILNINLIDALKLPQLKSLPVFYQEIVYALSKSQSIDYHKFKTTLLDQPLFGNKFIMYKNKGKLQPLYLENWINSGIKFVKDVKIVNGKVDTTYMYTKINNKKNIHMEMALFVNNINKHISAITLHLPGEDRNGRTIESNIRQKSKYFYNHLLQHKKENPKMNNKWHEINGNNVKFDNVFNTKIINMTDNKLRQINFKILHKILPCGENLKRWRKKDDDACTICGETESIVHLIYKCRYAANIWSIVQKCLNTEISLNDLIFGVNNNLELNFIISVVVYLIYKEWSNLSLVNERRPQTPNIRRYISELKYYRQICEQSDTMKNNTQVIQTLIDGFVQE